MEQEIDLDEENHIFFVGPETVGFDLPSSKEGHYPLHFLLNCVRYKIHII